MSFWLDGLQARSLPPGQPWLTIGALSHDDCKVSLRVTGEDVPISYVPLHGLLDFVHPKLVAFVTGSWREGNRVREQD